MKHTFKVGDRVQFKSWEEMEEEFGIDSAGDIKIQYYFTKSMKEFCNTYATIKKIYGDSEVLLKDFSKQGLCYGNYIFTLDMLKPVKEEKKYISNLPLDEQIKWHEEKLAKLKAQKEKEKWNFTEDEKVILRNLPEGYKWIARDMNGGLYIFTEKPRKNNVDWLCNYMNNFRGIPMFQHIFQCIQWSDTEPCEFRKYI